MTSAIARPFVKFVGGKTKLLPEILQRLPAAFNTYYEPFLGGGAVFFALTEENRFKNAVIGDANADLMRTYEALARDVDNVIRELKKHLYKEEYYYAVRKLRPGLLSLTDHAARFIYLNKTGFNGLYRVNKKGEFNVPFGRYTNPTICDEENLRTVAAVLGKDHGTAVTGDFERTVDGANKGDVVYFDPPYVPASETANFTAYTVGGFGLQDQIRLRDVAKRLAARGVHVLLSNSDTPLVRELYEKFNLEEVQVPRSINSKSGKRGKVGELLISGKTR
jgi:DNA adenine methylase